MGSINNLIIGLIKAAPISLTWINVKSITDIHRSLSWLSSSHYCCHRCYFDRTSAITPIFIVPANTASPSPDSDWVHLEDNAARKNTSITTNKAGGGAYLRHLRLDSTGFERGHSLLGCCRAVKVHKAVAWAHRQHRREDKIGGKKRVSVNILNITKAKNSQR